MTRDPNQTPEPADFKSVGRHMARGAAWMVGTRWVIKAIGLVNTLILARLLVPADFGLIAMAMIVVNLLQVVGEMNVDLALLRNPDATRAHYDSAWTVQILAGCLITTVLFLLAPVLAAYYGDPRVELVIQILSLRAIILGFRNIGLVDFRKEMNFSKEFRFWIYQRLLLFVFGLGMVVILGNYLGLALAAPVSALIGVALSYVMAPYRPRFSLARFREMWSFSQWLMLYNTSVFIGNRSDEFVVGGVTDAVTMGNYFMASDVSGMPTRELVMPIGRALVPTYARLAHDPVEIRAAICAVLGFLALLCFPVGVGMSVVADDFVHVVLGERWADSVPFFRYLAISGALATLILGMQPYFVVSGRERTFALFYAGYAALVVPLLFLAGWHQGIEAVPVVRLLGVIAAVVVLLGLTVRLGSASLADLAGVLWRPLIASAGMGWLVRQVHDDALPRLVSLAHDVGVGGVAYTILLFGLWLVAGRPAGAERILADLAGRRLRKGRRRPPGP